MAKFANIAKEKSKLSIDAENISVIVEVEEHHDKKNKTILSFSSLEEHGFLQIDPQSWNLDTDRSIREIEQAAGIKLIEIPLIWGDGKKLGRVFINPEAFNYIITSAPAWDDSSTEEHVALLLGMDGYGVVESYNVPVHKVDALMQAVAKNKNNLKRIDPEQATSRFIAPGYVVYDPGKISRIYPNGSDLDVLFENGGRIDFQLTGNIDDMGTLYLKSKFYDKPESKKQELKDSGAPEALYDKAIAFRDKMKTRLRREFARAIAKDAQGLQKIDKSHAPFYTRSENISWISRNEKTLYIEYKKASHEGGGMIGHSHVDFASEEKAAEALEKLQKQMAKPKGP